MGKNFIKKDIVTGTESPEGKIVWFAKITTQEFGHTYTHWKGPLLTKPKDRHPEKNSTFLVEKYILKKVD